MMLQLELAGKRTDAVLVEWVVAVARDVVCAVEIGLSHILPSPAGVTGRP